MGEYLNIHLRWNPDNKAHAEALKYLNKLHEAGSAVSMVSSSMH